MKEVAGIVTEGIKSGNVIFTGLAVIMGLVMCYKKIRESFEYGKAIKVKKLTDAVKCEYITGLTKALLEDALATEYFKQVTGLRLEKAFREAVITAHNNAHGEISFTHFKRALPYIFYKNQKLEIRINVVEGFYFILCVIVGALTALYGFSLIMLTLWFYGKYLIEFISNYKRLLPAFEMAVSGVLFVVIGIISTTPAFPIISARKIRKYLESSKTDTVQPADNTSANRKL